VIDKSNLCNLGCFAMIEPSTTKEENMNFKPNADELAKFREAMKQMAQQNKTMGWPVLQGAKK
jgi:hypothetical protein